PLWLVSFRDHPKRRHRALARAKAAAVTDGSATIAQAEQTASSAVEAGRRERRALAGRAGIVGAGTLVSRLLGLVRDTTLAALFTRAQTDAFWVAFTIPNALRQLLGEGVTSSAVVPVLSE